MFVSSPLCRTPLKNFQLPPIPTPSHHNQMSSISIPAGTETEDAMLDNIEFDNILVVEPSELATVLFNTSHHASESYILWDLDATIGDTSMAALEEWLS